MFDEGDKVKCEFNPSVNISPFKQRYFGKIGTILKKRGDCYEVSVDQKMLIIHPIHLKRL